MNEITPQNLTDHLRDFYAEKRLPEDAVKRILNETAAKNPGRRRWLIPGIMAAAALAIGLFVSRPDVTDRAFAEVAMHHSMELPSDKLTTDWELAEQTLSKLRFPLSPGPDALANVELLGARYCSVLSHPAALLRVARNGIPGTLYIVPATGQLTSIKPGKGSHSGVSVECWRTKDDRLFILAESKEQ